MKLNKSQDKNLDVVVFAKYINKNCIFLYQFI